MIGRLPRKPPTSQASTLRNSISGRTKIRMADWTKVRLKPIKVMPAVRRVTALPLAMLGGKLISKINFTVEAQPTNKTETHEAQPCRNTNPSIPKRETIADTATGALNPTHVGAASTIKEASKGIELNAKMSQVKAYSSPLARKKTPA